MDKGPHRSLCFSRVIVQLKKVIITIDMTLNMTLQSLIFFIKKSFMMQYLHTCNYVNMFP